MSNQPKYFNPFFALLLVVGIAFVVSCCAYGVMIIKFMNPGGPIEEAQVQISFLEFLYDHGNTILMVELALLTVCTFGAIMTDDFWKDRSERKRGLVSSEQEPLSNSSESEAGNLNSDSD
ncbi:MAG: hypothetical protein COA78_19545 [Blastopirellula sp.]|nr:MAG: hypothetical protein COA78_19545 [Blastopirellula sp.]